MIPSEITINGHTYVPNMAGMIQNIPRGFSIFQLGEDIQLYGKLRLEASDGCPAIFVTKEWDSPDTKFTKDWQLYMYAANFGMRKNNVAGLLGDTKFFTNDTGFGDPDEPRRNYIMQTNLSATEDPRLDKYRMMVLNSYACIRHDENYYAVWTQNGNNPPLMKMNPATGRAYPRPASVADIDSGKVKIEHYVYTPKTHLYAFHIPNNLKRKNGEINDSTISPFQYGIYYDWTPDPTQMYTFFPNVSNKGRILIHENFINAVHRETYPSPYRRGQ